MAATDDSAHVDLVRTMVQAINDKDLKPLNDIIAEDVVRHCAATPSVVVTNREEFFAFLREDFAAVPDSHVEADLIVGCGDYVALRARYSGTQSGPMGPFPASGRTMEIPFIGILRVEGGRIAEMWVEWDNLGMLVQLGHLPPPGA